MINERADFRCNLYDDLLALLRRQFHAAGLSPEKALDLASKHATQMCDVAFPLIYRDYQDAKKQSMERGGTWPAVRA